MAWLINYASVLVCRYNRGADGRTPYERSIGKTGKTWKQCLPEVGETVLYQPLKGERLASKLDARFEDGVYLGIQESSDDEIHWDCKRSRSHLDYEEET